MALTRLFAVLAAFAVAVAISGSTFAASKAQSVYVTEDTECDTPIDLEDNHVPAFADVYVWIKRATDYQVNNYLWSLWQGGTQVGDGEFVKECATTDGKYVLTWPDLHSEVSTGTFTLKVTWNGVGDYAFVSSDSFTVP
jgi:hypothetical protein